VGIATLITKNYFLVSFRLVIGLVDNDTFNGTKDKNPFNFQHFNIVEISVYCDGQLQYGMKPLTTDFTSNLLCERFQHAVLRNREAI